MLSGFAQKHLKAVFMQFCLAQINVAEYGLGIDQTEHFYIFLYLSLCFVNDN